MRLCRIKLLTPFMRCKRGRVMRTKPTSGRASQSDARSRVLAKRAALGMQFAGKTTCRNVMRRKAQHRGHGMACCGRRARRRIASETAWVEQIRQRRFADEAEADAGQSYTELSSRDGSAQVCGTADSTALAPFKPRVTISPQRVLRTATRGSIWRLQTTH